MRTAVFLSVLLAACATARTGGDGGGDGDGDGDGGNRVDADPNAPDADPNAADANGCDQQPCSLIPQCGCSGGMVCDLDSANLDTGATDCRAVNSPGTDTSSCVIAEQCAAGYTCLGPSGGAQCRRYCDGDPDCAGAGSLCALNVVFGSPAANVCWGPNPEDCAKVCTKSCDPTATAPPTCPSGFGCYIYGDGAGGDLTDCTKAPTSGGGVGATCQYSEDCAAGNICLITAGDDCTTTDGDPGACSCFQTCKYGQAGQCGTCSNLNPAIVIGGVTYGYCQ
jgi:hypothetical protein